ncbi:DUF718 domain-containing protein [Pelagibacterium xiamenense]|uniref:DUF718 domain-containing protein n=1 Tax=Pelagibacterium xiamenense TaxID=2901140 RepID=UPI001E3B87AD|nr:DUF718 domain-containing protein [Pelagibacterium xiamenense]MCD7060307.1 DUF718 domain-containing protein [Pelagibacterium xiamenense]
MRAYNCVRFRVKPGMEDEFIENQKADLPDFAGFRGGALIKTGDRTYCFIGEWDDFDKIVNARPGMIGMLDKVRHTLEDLGDGLGVSDPVSGEAVIEFPGTKQAHGHAA